MLLMGFKYFPCLSFILFLILSTERRLALGITTSQDDGHDNIRCPTRERQALLEIKASLRSMYTRRLDSWGSSGGHDDNDCCKWSGVQCSNKSGHVTGLDLSRSYEGCMIHPSLHELQHLSYLNLSGNNHSQCQIPSFIGNFTKLVQLDLSDSGFGGRIPPDLGNLSMLEFLDLSGNGMYESSIPYQFRNLSRLQSLDLGGNLYLLDNLDWVSHLHCLRYLNLKSLNLSKAVDWVQTIMNLPQLTRLDLEDSILPDVAPPNLTPENVSSSLSFIDLSSTGLTSSVFQWIFNFSSSLSEIHLEYNALRGPFPYAFGNMPSLIYLDLSANILEGNLPTCFGCTLPSLRYLALHNNRLKGDLSTSIRQLHKLRRLDVSSNSFHGLITENHLNDFSSLKWLTLDSNSLTLHLSPQWVPPFQLFTMGLGSCNLGPQFPSWIETQTSLDILDISSNRILGTIPEWFWNLSSQVSYLNISDNELYGMVPSKLLSQSLIEDIDLSSNHFEGQIPLFNRRIVHINLSKNKFSGSLSNLCQFKGENLIWLDLSENFLSGELPNCWKKKGLERLIYINLSYNSLAGRIPNMICSSLDWWIHILLLRDNSFSGELPSSLSNCSSLAVLDVANNMISGSIPELIGDHLRELSILILRSNQFSGSLPTNLCWLQYIQVIDISFNNISGHVLDCLGNSSVLTNKEMTGLYHHFAIARRPQNGLHYQIHDRLVWKGIEYDYKSNNLHVKSLDFHDKLVWKGIEYDYKSSNLNIKIVDFSSNNLQGEIPEEFRSLIALGQLNLSNNNLSGHIPHKLGEMSMLEVLDLSSNHLSGDIPQSISNLSFLASLNLSYNSLSGQIPMGTQIQSFTAASFMGNSGLCGLPLPKKCHQEEAPPPSSNFGGHEEENKDTFISKGFYISMSVGFVIGFWGFVGPLLFHNFWSSAYFRFLNSVADWIYVVCALTIARIQRRLAR